MDAMTYAIFFDAIELPLTTGDTPASSSEASQGPTPWSWTVAGLALIALDIAFVAWI